MRRELRANGGIMGAVQREKFGLGSRLKKFARKIIPNEIADIAVKAAPFVAPFNPALAGAMAGIGSFDQTGSISKGVKSGLINYGLGQGARYLGGADFQGNPFGSGGGFTPGTAGTGTFSKYFSKPTGSGGIKNLFNKSPQDGIIPISGSDYGQYTFGQGDKLGGEMLTTGVTDTAATSIKSTNPFMDSAKKLISGDFTEMGEGLKELGGQGLKAVFTKPHPTIKGKIIFDKTAAFATIAGGATYLDAKRLAEEAELVVDGDEYTEDMYEADKAFYLKKYQKALPSESFYKKGGRVKYGNGSGDGIPSIMLEENEENDLDVEALNETLRKYPNSINEITDFEPGIFGPNEPTDQGPYPMDDKTQEEKEAEMLYELERELNGQKDGGRIGFAGGSEDFNSQVDMAKKIFQEYYLERKEGDFKSPEVLLEVSKETGLSLEDSELARSMYENYIVNQNIQQRFENEKYGEAGVPLLTLDSSGEIIDDGLYKGKKDGGRIGYGLGDLVRGSAGVFQPTSTSMKSGNSPMRSGSGMGGMLSNIINNNPQLFSSPTGQRNNSVSNMSRDFIDLNENGIDDREEVAQGGRIGFKDGPKFKGKPLDYTGSGKDSPQKRSGIISINPMQDDLESLGGGIGGALSPFSRAEKSFLFKTLAKGGGADRTFTMPDLYRTLKNPGKFLKDEAALKAFLKIKGFKKGGRIGFNMGTEVPVRNNQGGITELDYRNTGGFVPIGVKEKADDVPAMLSKNEFVFTADAVRAAGGGSMNKGAQKMYGLMKSLENKVV